MGNLARKRELEPAVVTEEVGTVVAVDGPVLLVETATREVRSRRATSCLLEPAVGDLVLLACLPRRHAYVLAVLEREEGAPATIVADGSLQIKVCQGDLALSAANGVRIVSGNDVSVVSATVQVRSADAHIAFDRLSYLGTFLRAQIDRTSLIGKSIDTLAERVSQRVKRFYRVIEESDHVRAARIDYAATSTLSLKAETAVISASHLAKVDGDQIHLG